MSESRDSKSAEPGALARAEQKREDNISIDLGHILKPEDVKENDPDALGKLVIANSTYVLNHTEEKHMPISVETVNQLRDEGQKLSDELKHLANEKRRVAKEMTDIDPSTFVNPYVTVGDCARFVLGANYKGERLVEYIKLAKQLEQFEVNMQIKNKRRNWILSEISYQCENLA